MLVNIANLKIILLSKKNIDVIEKIWRKSLSNNLKAIIGSWLIKYYLETFFYQKKNLGIGIVKSNKIVGFILFGNNKKILQKILKEKIILIICSFVSNLIRLKFKKLINYFDVIIFLIIEKIKKKNILQNNIELLIIAVKKDKQNQGLGSFLIKNSILKYKKYFTSYNNIIVKTLSSTPENILFYQKNNFVIKNKIFKRVYLQFKTSKENY